MAYLPFYEYQYYFFYRHNPIIIQTKGSLVVKWDIVIVRTAGPHLHCPRHTGTMVIQLRSAPTLTAISWLCLYVNVP